VGAGWLWDPAHTDVARSVEFLPLTLSDPVYAEATPLTGVVHPETHELDPAGEFHFAPPTAASAGSILRLLSNGAGGWGDPLERAPDQVLRDVRDEYVTVEGAARDYGVVVVGDPHRDPEGLALDEAATNALRARRRP
jgi:N-methylhydantoinase B